MILLEKQILRSRMQESLRALPAAERRAKSAALAGHLRGLGGLVFGFAPLNSEPAWMGPEFAGRLALPRIVGNEVVFHRVADWNDLARGAFGAREPRGDEATRVPVEAADVILVPGLAFGRDGSRLGRGGGFYDRLLGQSAIRARRVGVCFSAQLAATVPVEAHDARVDAIVTEDGWHEPRSSGRGRD